VADKARLTARLVIIGNEVLSGKVLDANTPFLLRRLRQVGVDCQGVVVVADVPAEISAAVRHAAEAADLVFTTGGVGPTHDDVTMASIADAFDVPLVEHPKLLEFLEERWRGPRAPARLRMARVPQGADLLFEGEFPQVRMRNVYIFPGVPKLLRRRFAAIEHLFAGQAPCCAAVFTDETESELAPLLEQVVAQLQDVEIGSYPQWGEASYRVLLTIEAASQAVVDEGVDRLVELLDPDRLQGVERSYHPEGN